MDNVAVIIPALNEAGNIGRLVSETLATVDAQVIVVDNGSIDDTAVEALNAGAFVVSEPRQGYGYACASGVEAAKSAHILAFLDGDYSFLPSELPRLLEPILTNNAEMVLGSRVKGEIVPGAMPPHQRFGNMLVARLTNLLYGLEITDLGPYRAVRRNLVVQLDMQEMTYGWHTEMIVKAARLRSSIVEVPVSYHPRQAGRSKVSGTLRGTLLASWFILGVTLRYALTPRERI